MKFLVFLCFKLLYYMKVDQLDEFLKIEVVKN